MKFIVFFALVTFANAKSVKPTLTALEQEALWMIACANQTMFTGLPAAGVPPYYPDIAIPDISQSIGGNGAFRLQLEITGAKLAGVPFYNTPEVKGVSDGSTVQYDWSIFWPKFVFSGYVDWQFSVFWFTPIAGQRAHFNIEIDGVRWWGIWNMTLPKNVNTLPYLNDLTLLSSAENVKTTVIDVGIPEDLLLDNLFSQVAKYAFNNFPATVGNNIKDLRFNGYWLNKEHPERLKAVLENCGLNPWAVL